MKRIFVPFLVTGLIFTNINSAFASNLPSSEETTKSQLLISSNSFVTTNSALDKENNTIIALDSALLATKDIDTSSWLKDSLSVISNNQSLDLSSINLVSMPSTSDIANVKYTALKKQLEEDLSSKFSFSEGVSLNTSTSSALKVFEEKFGGVEKANEISKSYLNSSFDANKMISSFNEQRTSAYRDLIDTEAFKNVSQTISAGNTLSKLAQVQNTDYTISLAALDTLLENGSMYAKDRSNSALISSMSKANSYATSEKESAKLKYSESQADAESIYNSAVSSITSFSDISSLISSIYGENIVNNNVDSNKDAEYEEFLNSNDYLAYRDFEESGGITGTEEEMLEIENKYDYFKTPSQINVSLNSTETLANIFNNIKSKSQEVYDSNGEDPVVKTEETKGTLTQAQLELWGKYNYMGGRGKYD